MLEDGHKAVRLVISGRVQGVFFRDWTLKEATALKLDGWVRNRSDGTVEALLVGPDSDVDNMTDRCRIGPTSAKVDQIEISKAVGITKHGFFQKPTVNINERRGL